MTNVLFDLWNTALERFFNSETELFYEFVEDETTNAWNDLPNIEEINALYPNPCGWGTGMEDSVMNGSTALDALISAHSVGVEIDRTLASSLANGLLRCQFNDKNEGFVARSFSPIDQRSHYIESSRDQYTHFMYSLTRYALSDLSSESERKSIQKAVCAVAEKCRREVTAQNNYHMLREDCSIGMVNKMWGTLGAHEYMRLPMFYLCAYAVSGKDDYLKLYHTYRDEALEKSMDFDKGKSRLYCSLQMMCSLRAVYEYDNDADFRSKLLPLMTELAEYGERKAIANADRFSKPEHKRDVDYAFKSWRAVKLRDSGEFNGYRYQNPGQSELAENVAFYPVREVGEGAILASMCPCRRVSSELLESLVKIANAIDTKKHSSVYALLYTPSAYAFCLENHKLNS